VNPCHYDSFILQNSYNKARLTKSILYCYIYVHLKGEGLASRKNIVVLGQIMNPNPLFVGMKTANCYFSDEQIEQLEVLPDEIILSLIKAGLEKHASSVREIERSYKNHITSPNRSIPASPVRYSAKRH